MKYLVLVAILFVVIWLIRASRRADPPRQDGRPPAQPQVGAPEDMVRCPVCALHLPRADALPGPDGQLYCCAEHRAKA